MRIFLRQGLRVFGLSGLLWAGCQDPITLVGDDRAASFGGAAAKSDGRYSECVLAEVLKYVNESSTSDETLKAARLKSEAARAIYAHRVGADGLLGTADDDLFDDLAELDAVDFVGPVALDALAGQVVSRCEVDLDKRPFIDETTFASETGGGWERNNDEIEGIRALSGLTGAELRALLSSTDGQGRTLFSRLRKNRIMEAFTYGYAIDEMPWDENSHAAREGLPYIILTIESDRFEPNAEGRREISLGTDYMDDTYFDTLGYDLLRSEATLRGRARWDSPTEVRRVLVGAKFGSTVDDQGIKSAFKVDVRGEGPERMAALDNDIRRGRWNAYGDDKSLEPVKAVYEAMTKAGALPDIGSKKKVLLLDPKLHLRSLRSRYHLDEARTDRLVALHRNGRERLEQMIAVARARRDQMTNPTAQARVDELLALAGRTLDDSELIARVGAAGQTIAANDGFRPDAWQVNDLAQLAKAEVVANQLSGLYHELASRLDEVDRDLFGLQAGELEDRAGQFRAFVETQRPELKIKTTWDAFLADCKALRALPDGERQAKLAALNEFGRAQRDANNDAFEDFADFSDAELERLELRLGYEVLRIAARQIAAGGTMAQALWFDSARAVYVPASSRAFSNFMIDTFDWTDMLSHEEWESIPAAERTIERPLPAEKVFHTTLVNELQIELGSEAEYVKRIKELEAQKASGTPPEGVDAQLSGAKMVFEEYRKSLNYLAEIKGQNVLSRLRRAGAGSKASWGPTTQSKGVIGLTTLANRD